MALENCRMLYDPGELIGPCACDSITCTSETGLLCMSPSVDVNSDNKVDLEDLLSLLGLYGRTGTQSADINSDTRRADINSDNKVNIEDILIVLGSHGKNIGCNTGE